MRHLNKIIFINSATIRYQEILIDGKYQMTAIIKTPDQTQIHIPLQENSLTSPYLNLELKFPDRVQPKKIGIGDDERELAIGLISVSYH